jgi:hypothetical protein
MDKSTGETMLLIAFALGVAAAIGLLRSAGMLMP